MDKRATYDMQLPNGEVIPGLTRREVLGLIGIDEQYNNSLVKSETDGPECWLPILEWANRDYAAMEESGNYYIEGEPLEWWESLMALAFIYPKRWRLLSFSLKNKQFRLVFGNGDVAEFTYGGFKASINIDKQYRRKIDIKLNNGKKYGFFESLMGYADSDFELMIRLLEAEESAMMKFTVTLDNFNRTMRRAIQRN